MNNNRGRAPYLPPYSVDGTDYGNSDQTDTTGTALSNQGDSPPQYAIDRQDSLPPYGLTDFIAHVAAEQEDSDHATLHYSGEPRTLRALLRQNTSRLLGTSTTGTIVREQRRQSSDPDTMEWYFDPDIPNNALTVAEIRFEDGQPAATMHPEFCLVLSDLDTGEVRTVCPHPDTRDANSKVCWTYAVINDLDIESSDGSIQEIIDLENDRAIQGKTSIRGTVEFGNAAVGLDYVTNTVWEENQEVPELEWGVVMAEKGENLYSSPDKILDEYHFKFFPEDGDFPPRTIFKGTLLQFGRFHGQPRGTVPS